MNNFKEEFKEMIYHLMIGSFDLEHYPIKESEHVENEYAEGKFCAKAYEDVYNADRRLCERLEVDVDEDIELIITHLLGIGKHLSLKMFDYVVFFSSPSIK